MRLSPRETVRIPARERRGWRNKKKICALIQCRVGCHLGMSAFPTACWNCWLPIERDYHCGLSEHGILNRSPSCFATALYISQSARRACARAEPSAINTQSQCTFPEFSDCSLTSQLRCHNIATAVARLLITQIFLRNQHIRCASLLNRLMNSLFFFLRCHLQKRIW